MSHDTESPIDRITPTSRPAGRPVGYQTWTDLLFVHWRVSAAELQELVPQRLTIDTFDGSAWIGLVPFHMSGVRPWWSPNVPGVSTFHETNVRTYVHLDGQDPGVWFFSLDAANRLAVWCARRWWHLNYHWAQMHIAHSDGQVQYESRRRVPKENGAHCKIQAELGDLIESTPPNLPAGRATPGTLEHFLAERYFLYAQSPDGELRRGQVHHAPYPLHAARLNHLDENLISQAGVTLTTAPAHVLYSPGVQVDIFGLKAV